MDAGGDRSSSILCPRAIDDVLLQCGDQVDVVDRDLASCCDARYQKQCEIFYVEAAWPIHEFINGEGTRYIMASVLGVEPQYVFFSWKRDLSFVWSRDSIQGEHMSELQTAQNCENFFLYRSNLNCIVQKCDGQRPVCRPCSTSVSYGDCEYPELGGGMTRTQALEEQIAILESRIQQLEDPSNPGGAVLLAQPYASQVSSGGSDLAVNEGVSELSTVVQAVLQNSMEIGFFLHPSRFIHSLSSPHPHGRPLPALLSCILLWGSHLYGVNRHESTILARALRDTAQGLASGHPQAVMHCIQAEVLLSHYFYRQARFVEARYHTGTAVSIALSAQLHKNARSGLVPPPGDGVEEGERVNGFWTVFVLGSCWSAVEGSPAPFPYPEVDVPWPLDIEGYAQASRPTDWRCRGTVQRFLENQEDSGTSTLALHAKASILFAQASRIVQGYRPGMNQQQTANFFACYNALNTAIENFTAKLPPPATATAVVIHSLAHAAMIRIHAPFLAVNPSSRGRMAGSVRALVRVIEAVDIPGLLVVDSIIGMIWARSCQVLIPEMSSSEPARMLATIVGVMERMRGRYPVINDQLGEVRAAQQASLGFTS